MFLPAVVVYSLYAAPDGITTGPRFGRLLPVFSGFALGTGLAGFYIVPLVWHSKLFDLAGLARYNPAFQFGQHFVFFPPINAGNRRLPAIMAVAVLFTVATALWIALKRKRWAASSVSLLGITLLAALPAVTMPAVRSAFDASVTWDPQLKIELLATLMFTLSIALLARAYTGRNVTADLLLALSGLAAVSMLPWSAWLWRIAWPLQTIQFPWRLCALLCVFASGLVVLALNHAPRLRRRVMIGSWAIVVAVCFILWRVDASLITPSDWVRPVAQFDRTIPDPMGYIYVDPASRSKFLATVESSSHLPFAAMLSGRGSFRAERAGPGHITISFDAATAIGVSLRQFYFPLWSSSFGTLRAGKDGLMELSLPAGKGVVDVTFSSVRPWGIGLTLASLLVFFMLASSRARSRSEKQDSDVSRQAVA